MSLDLDPSAPPAELRRALRSLPGTRFVSWLEYRELLVSRMPLERADEPRAGCLGLRDLTSGRRFLVAAEEADAAATAGALRSAARPRPSSPRRG